MQSSSYVNALPAILAEMQEEREEDEKYQARQEEEEPEKVVYVYPLEGGGVVLTETPIEDEPEPQILDSEPPATDQRPTTPKEPPYFLHFLLILLFFVLLDSADTTLTALMTPTATITIVPQVKTITLQSTITLGKLLSPITVSQSQTIPTTGHGHQGAREAIGTLTLYNGLSTVQSVPAGTILTGADGAQIATDAAVTVPPANPPSLGETSVNTHATQPGRAGNIQAEDINTTLSAGVYVKNLTAFTGGLDERDYLVVTRADRDTTGVILQAKVSASMTAALEGQLLPGEALQETPCTPTVTANHTVGDEAGTLTVTASETCTAIVYNSQQLTDQATTLLTTQARKTLGAGYSLYGTVQLTITKATEQTPTVFLSFTSTGTWIYQINEAKVTSLVTGKPRLEALQVLFANPGIKSATIEGVKDNQILPTEADHIHIVVLFFAQ